MIRTANAGAREQNNRTILHAHNLTAAEARTQLAQRHDWNVFISDAWTLRGEYKADWHAIHGAIALHEGVDGWHPNPAGSEALIASLNYHIPYIDWGPDEGDYKRALKTHRDIISPFINCHASDCYYRDKGSSYIQIADELFYLGTKDSAGLGAASFLESGLKLFWRLRCKHERTVNGIIRYGWVAALEANGPSPHAISPASLFSDATINRAKKLQWAA